jgi:hypothetical protein
VASILHGSARTTLRIRGELKAAQASVRLLASQYGLNVKTVLKWRSRAETTDAAMGRCVWWYLRFRLSFQDLVEMMAERGLSIRERSIH